MLLLCPPDTVLIQLKGLHAMIRQFQVVSNTLVPSESEGSPVLMYVNPDADERQALLTTHNIDEHTLSSALDPDEVPRIEFDADQFSIIWKRPMNYSGQDNFFFNVASVGLFLSKERLVIVLTEEIPLSGPGTRQIARIESLLDVLLNVLYNMIHHYLEHLKVIKLIARELQQRINTSMENEFLIQMFNLSESLVYYVNAINANNAVLQRLRNHAEKMSFGPDVIELLDDILIENNQCFKQAEIYSTVFSGLMDARGTLVNNNMSLLLKNLTIINVVFLPLNLIASIGGMSEFSMMTQGTHWTIAYSLFLIAMVMIGSVTAYVLGRMNIASATPKASRRSKFRKWKKAGGLFRRGR